MTQLLDRTNPKLKELRIFVQFSKEELQKRRYLLPPATIVRSYAGNDTVRKRYSTFFNWTVKPLSRQKTNLSPGNPGYAEGGFLLAQKREP